MKVKVEFTVDISDEEREALASELGEERVGRGNAKEILSEAARVSLFRRLDEIRVRYIVRKAEEWAEKASRIGAEDTPKDKN